MITASSDFITAVNQASRQFRARFIVNNSPLDCDIGNVRCYKGSCGGEIALGCVYAPYIEATLRRCEDNIDGEELTYQIGLFNGSDFEYIDIGVFTVLDSKSGNGSTTFTAVGTLAQIGNDPYTSLLDYPSPISVIANELSGIISAATGKTVSFKGFPAANLTGQVPYAITGPIREALSTIAALLGGFVSEDNAGNIVIAKYNCGETLSIEPYRSLEIPEIRDTPYRVLGVHVTVSDATEDEEGQPVPEVYFEYGTPIISQKIPWMTQSVFNAMVLQFCGLVFDLSSFEISLGDPRLEPWDIISLEDLAGNTYNISPFSMVHVFDGGVTTRIEAEVSSSGASSAAVKGALQKYVERLDANIYEATISAARAKKIAEDAEEALVIIGQDVEAANSLLADMEEAAEEADTTLTRIYRDATEAKQSAETAYVATNSAMYQLGVVENIVGVLEMLQKNGEYVLTEDTEVQPSKWYFQRNGTSPDYTYKVVTVAEGQDPSSLGLYELTGINESIQNYVSSHLVLTDSGLSLQTENSGYRIDITPEGIIIIDGNGFQVASYGETATIGAENGFHIVLGENENDVAEIGFYNGRTRVAYMNGSELYVENSLAFGHFTFIERPNGHFTLKLIRSS